MSVYGVQSTMMSPQQQAPQLASPQGVSGSDDALVGALAKYVTTGLGSRHTTKSEIQEMVAATVSKPGGRAHLEALCHCDNDPPQRACWEKKSNCHGVITISKAGINFDLKAPALSVSVTGDIAGFFIPFVGPLA